MRNLLTALGALIVIYASIDANKNKIKVNKDLDNNKNNINDNICYIQYLECIDSINSSNINNKENKKDKDIDTNKEKETKKTKDKKEKKYNKLLRGSKTIINNNNDNNNSNSINTKGDHHPINKKSIHHMRSWKNPKSMTSHLPTIPTKFPANTVSSSPMIHHRYNAYSDHTNRRLEALWGILGSPIVGESSHDYFGYSVSVSADGKTVAAGAMCNNDDNQGGHVRIFIYSSNSNKWNQLGGTKVGVSSHDRFGWSVSLSADGKTFAAGALFNADNGDYSGHVRIFTYSSKTNNWNQLGDAIVGVSSGDMFGESVSVSADGKIVAAGAIWAMTIMVIIVVT